MDMNDQNGPGNGLFPTADGGTADAIFDDHLDGGHAAEVTC